MVVTRTQLSSYTDGRPLTLSLSSSVTLHQMTSSGTHYVYVSMYNMGLISRVVRLTISGSSTTSDMMVTLRGNSKNTQLVLPGLPLYNSGTGVSISASLAHASAPGWSFPTSLADSVTITNGQIVGLSTMGITAAPGAQPVLIVVKDEGRSTTDVDPAKGTTGIIELSEVQGAILVNVLTAGRDFVPLQITATAHTGVLTTGYVLTE